MSLALLLAGGIIIVIPSIESASPDGAPQCGGGKPMENLGDVWGISVSYPTADHICCNNHRYAERWGYHEDVGFFDALEKGNDKNDEFIFYDSVCGKPLFVAPRGRTFSEWKKESIDHGWPSFRPEELVSENVIIHSRGRMESICGTHLGHNLPSGGRDRYCIDLVCIAGRPSAVFDPSNYTSSAKDDSGKSPRTSAFYISIIALSAALVAGAYAVYYKKTSRHLSASFSHRRARMKKKSNESLAEKVGGTDVAAT